MSKIILGYPNYITNQVQITGGSWVSSLPVVNLSDRQITKVARTTNAENTSSKILIDLGASRSLATFALINHNLSQEAQWRISVGTTEGDDDVFNSGLLDVWTIDVEVDSLLWGSPNWWGGIWEDQYLGHPYQALHVLTEAKEGRYLTIEIYDSANPNGYIQIGRAFAGDFFIPAINASYGLKDGWIDLSSSNRSESGTRFYTPRRKYRYVRFALDRLTLSEGNVLHELQAILGQTEEILYAPNTDDPATIQRYGFVGTMQELSPLDYPYISYRSMGFNIEELV